MVEAFAAGIVAEVGDAARFRDAIARGREDLVARYTAELSEVVESTSYAEVIANIRKELG